MRVRRLRAWTWRESLRRASRASSSAVLAGVVSDSLVELGGEFVASADFGEEDDGGDEGIFGGGVVIDFFF